MLPSPCLPNPRSLQRPRYGIFHYQLLQRTSQMDWWTMALMLLALNTCLPSVITCRRNDLSKQSPFPNSLTYDDEVPKDIETDAHFPYFSEGRGVQSPRMVSRRVVTEDSAMSRLTASHLPVVWGVGAVTWTYYSEKGNRAPIPTCWSQKLLDAEEPHPSKHWGCRQAKEVAKKKAAENAQD